MSDEIDKLTKLAKACKDMEKVDCFAVDPTTAAGIEITAIMSIAISLKRIADSMEGRIQPVVMTAEEYAKWKALKEYVK